MRSDLISPVHKANKVQREVQSTDEILGKVEEAIIILKERKVKEGILGSMDVEALFLSIYQKVSARIVGEEMMRNEVKYGEVNIQVATHYLMATMTPDRIKREGVSHLMPRRKGMRGRKPMIHTRELSGPIKRIII